MTFFDAFLQVLSIVFSPQMVGLYTCILAFVTVIFLAYVLTTDWVWWAKTLALLEIAFDVFVIISLAVWVDAAPSATSWVSS